LHVSLRFKEGEEDGMISEIAPAPLCSTAEPTIKWAQIPTNNANKQYFLILFALTDADRN